MTTESRSEQPGQRSQRQRDVEAATGWTVNTTQTARVEYNENGDRYEWAHRPSTVAEKAMWDMLTTDPTDYSPPARSIRPTYPPHSTSEVKGT